MSIVETAKKQILPCQEVNTALFGSLCFVFNGIFVKGV